MGDQGTNSEGASPPVPSGTPPATLRPTEPGDAGFLRRLYASTRLEELALLPPPQWQAFLELQWRARQREYQAAYPGAEDRIVMVEGAPAGRLLMARTDGALVVVDIALLPEFRRRGIGSRLLRRLLDEAAGSGLVVRLHVALSNPALRLYERLGFLRVAESGPYAVLERGTNTDS